tara:strand:+ start:4361 stop:4837 length:477 start_codon:yes stop_codon:yes gene_type:complete
MRFFTLLLTFVIFGSTMANALDVSPDGPLIINLREDAQSVIVGNPNHASVSLDNPRLLIVTAGIPGVTSLTVLGENGRVIMNDKIISGGSAQGYVRIQNACINAQGACQPVKMFYCEEGSACHNVVVAETAPTASTQGTTINEGSFAQEAAPQTQPQF